MERFRNVQTPESLEALAERVGFDLVSCGVDGQRPEISYIYFTKALPDGGTLTVNVVLDAFELSRHSDQGPNAFARWLWDHITEQLIEALLAVVVDLKQECSYHP